MANPTSNFNWQMPTSSDLVTDLPADFEVFGQAVDTSLADLKGGTTGQVLKKNTNADMDFVWGAVAGDIEGVTAGVGITGGGTSGTVTITNDMATTITAAGDIVVGTGSGTYDNLPIGTTAQVLTADTTVSPYKVKWATPAAGGGMTLLSTTSMASSAQINLTSINQTYKDLVVLINQTTWDTSDSEMRMLFNAANGAWGNGAFNSTSLSPFNDDNVKFTLANNTDRTVAQTHYCLIKNYASTTAFKPFQFSGSAQVSAGGIRASFGAGSARTTSAITSLRFETAHSNTFNAGTILLYGVN
jgi:hypothetical protein